MFYYETIPSHKYPAPLAAVRVTNPADPSKFYLVKGLVDTGSPITCIPEEALNSLGDLYYGMIMIKSPFENTQPSKVKTYIINLRIADYDFQKIEVLTIPKQYAILGRDILNKLDEIVLQPSKGVWSIGRKEDEDYDKVS